MISAMQSIIGQKKTNVDRLKSKCQHVIIFQTMHVFKVTALDSYKNKKKKQKTCQSKASNRDFLQTIEYLKHQHVFGTYEATGTAPLMQSNQRRKKKSAGMDKSFNPSPLNVQPMFYSFFKQYNGKKTNTNKK
jgi:hypothetical protein